MRLKLFYLINRFVTRKFKSNKIITNYTTVNQLKKIMPDLLDGYLSEDEIPNSLILIPPPPKHNSKAFVIDLEYAKKMDDSKNHIRLRQAANDAILSFPDAIKSFELTLGIEISEKQTPNFYTLLRRIMTDAGFSTYAAKNYYNRKRPFVINNMKTCTSEQEEILRNVGSYPSGHAAIGWAWAIVFSELFPSKKNVILKRGYDFGESRIICNVHWYSDVAMGRIMGKATIEKLRTNLIFQKDLVAAKKEISRMKYNIVD